MKLIQRGVSRLLHRHRADGPVRPSMPSDARHRRRVDSDAVDGGCRETGMTLLRPAPCPRRRGEAIEPSSDPIGITPSLGGTTVPFNRPCLRLSELPPGAARRPRSTCDPPLCPLPLSFPFIFGAECGLYALYHCGERVGMLSEREAIGAVVSGSECVCVCVGGGGRMTPWISVFFLLLLVIYMCIGCRYAQTNVGILLRLLIQDEDLSLDNV